MYNQRAIPDTKKWSGRWDSNPRQPAWEIGVQLPLHVSPHKPMTVLIPDGVILWKPMEVGIGVESGVENPY